MSKPYPTDFITLPVIGMCGFARAGKDTAAQGLMNAGWKRVAFADELKADVEQAVSRSLASGQGPHGTKFSLSNPEVKELLRPLLVEYGRGLRALDGGHWIARAADTMARVCGGNTLGLYCGIVVTDVRYPNEADWIRSLGGAVIRVVRPCPVRARPFGFIPSVRRRYPGAFPANAEEARTVPFVECDAEIINDGSEGLLMQRAFETALRLVPKRDQENNTNDTPCS